jgi:hypothetical protein
MTAVIACRRKLLPGSRRYPKLLYSTDRLFIQVIFLRRTAPRSRSREGQRSRIWELLCALAEVPAGARQEAFQEEFRRSSSY